MKTFKELTESVLSEGGEYYPADSMTMDELRIACNAAENIIDMLSKGAMIQRWQISAIVKASDELASVCTSMRVDFDEDQEEIAGYEYPWMGEETDLSENSKVDDFRMELIRKTIEDAAEGKKDIRGVAVEDIVAAYASKKNFGNNTIDQLGDELGLPDGVIIRLAKAVKEELKANMSSSNKTQTQAQRIDRYLKQKWVKK